MTIKIEITEDIIKLMSNFRFKELPNDDEYMENLDKWGLDINNLYGGSYLYEDMAYALGRYDEHIEGSEDEAEGPDFKEDFKEYMRKTHHYIIDNIKGLMEIMVQFCNKGGVTPGTYKCKNYDRIWVKI